MKYYLSSYKFGDKVDDLKSSLTNFNVTAFDIADNKIETSSIG